MLYPYSSTLLTPDNLSTVLQIIFCANKLANESIKSCYKVNPFIIIRTRDMSQYITKKVTV